MGKKKQLTIKQEKFCREMALHGNASAAYRNAYDCRNMSDRSIVKEANNLKEKPLIAERIDELVKQTNERYQYDKQTALNLLARVIGFDVKDLYITNEETGRSRLRKPDELPIATRNIIQQIDEKDGNVRYKMYNKIDAIKQLSVLLGWERIDLIENDPRLVDGVFRIGYEEENKFRIGFKDKQEKPKKENVIEIGYD